MEPLNLVLSKTSCGFQNYGRKFNHMNTPDFVREFEVEHQGIRTFLTSVILIANQRRKLVITK